MRPGPGAALVLALAGAAAAQDAPRPAELPPPAYRGQQYVDSRGCLFMRAGPPGQEMWLPRVTREGAPLCGNPPSGRRVPVAGAEGAAADIPAPSSAPVAAGHYVAVGSFGVADNVRRAEERLRALNYAVALGRPGAGGLVTVFAGPFPSAQDAARARGELRQLGFPDAIVTGAP